MGDANTGKGYGYYIYSMFPEQQKNIVVKESNADILARDGFEKVFERFLNAEPPELKELRKAEEVARQKWKASDSKADYIAYTKAREKVENYGDELELTPASELTSTPDTTPFEKLLTSQESNIEKKEEPQKEKTFESLLNKLNTTQEEEPRRNAFNREVIQEDEQPLSRNAFNREVIEEDAQRIQRTQAPDFLEAYKNAIETNSTNTKNEDIAAVYKPSVPPVETWIEKLDKDALLNKNKPIPKTIPYRRGTGLGDHMGADASNVIDALGRRGISQEEEQPIGAFGRGTSQEEEQPIDAFNGRRNGFDPFEYYA